MIQNPLAILILLLFLALFAFWSYNNAQTSSVSKSTQFCAIAEGDRCLRFGTEQVEQPTVPD
jgi:hypothetical protein